ncbi:hypothetical protein [Nonomuraea jabiensis]|uniref:hypothetical protein n=1 Tax=Nonomuraea jabiensis TaxID=882448 RepID=UPI0036CA972C
MGEVVLHHRAADAEVRSGIQRRPPQRGFWLVRHTPASQAQGKIVAVASLTPRGFGTQQIDLHTPPETHTSPPYATVHGARIQPYVLNDPGKISITSTVGTGAVKASCRTRGYSFPANQHPRFIDVPVTAFFTPKTP